MTTYAPTVAPVAAPVSPLAVPGEPLRQRAWVRRLPVYGVCVHTTGSGPATKAKSRRATPLQIALDYYVRGNEGFPHYVIDYDGSIHAVCDEGHIAFHAGWLGRGKRRWAAWTPSAWWSTVWRRWNVTSPAGLLPTQADDPNSVYIGVELLADTTGWGFTPRQYDALARFVVDVCRRHNVPLSEPPTPRLLGHEDLEPIDRADAYGGWDPGAHRQTPRFSWATLWSRIQAQGTPGVPAPVAAPPPPPPVQAAQPAPDANRLTDSLFNARYAERGGRPIAANESGLRNEWLWLRSEIQSLLAGGPVTAAPAGSATPPASFFTRGTLPIRRFAALVPLLDRSRGAIPLEFLLGWAWYESRAQIDSLTPPPLDERGFFQVSAEESAEHRPPFNHRQISTDPDYSVRAGIALATDYMARTQRQFPTIPVGSDIYWRVVRSQHAMGIGLAPAFVNALRARGPVTPQTFRQFELSPEGEALHVLLRKEPGRFSRNIDYTMLVGPLIARLLGR